MTEKRIYICFIMIGLGVLLLSHRVMAVTIPTSGYCGVSDNEESVMWKYEDGVLTISGNGPMQGYPYYNGYRAPWYPYKDTITKVVIGKGITSIGNSAFYEMRYLREVELPEGLEWIEGWAFGWCIRLTEITFPSSLTSMGESAFSSTSLTRVCIPGSLESVPYSAMRDLMYACGYVEGILDKDDAYSVVTLEEGVKCLDVNAFCEGNIRTIYLPASLESVKVSSISWDRVNAIYGRNDYMKQIARKNYAVYVDATQTYDVADIYCKTNLDGNVQSKPKVTLAYSFDGDEVLLNEGIDYSITYEEDGMDGYMVITGMGCYQGTKRISYNVYRKLASCQVTLEETEYWRTGNPIKPEITVTDQGVVLEQEVDYEVAYSNNVERGTATVKVTGTGRYVGECTRMFRIQTKDLYELGCTLSQYSYVYDGRSHIPDVVIRDEGKTLVRGRDYDYSIDENTVQPGIIYVNLCSVGHGKYTLDRSFVVSYEITRGVIDDTTQVSLSQSQYRYDGFPKTPEVTVSCNGVTLYPGQDYTAQCRDNWNVGQAYVIITGVGNYEGEVKIPFEILPQETNGNEVGTKRICSVADLTIQPIKDLTYCGEAMEPELMIMYGDKLLEQDQDYTVTYSDNIDAGTATAVIQGTGNYTGTRLVTYNIRPYDVSRLSNVLKGKDGKMYEAEYTGKAIRPTTAFRLAVQYKGENVYLYPKEGQDYSCEYKNNKKVGIASIRYTFKGNYTGVVVKNFRIIPKAPKLKVKKKSNGNRLIRWKAVKNSDYYEVYRKSAKKGKYKRIAKVKRCSYEDKAVSPDKVYYYKIVACKKRGKKVYRSKADQEKSE